VSPQNATSIGACDPALNDGDLNQLLSDTAVAPLPKTLASAEHKQATNFVSASDIRPPPGLPHPALGSNDSPSGNERKKGASPCRTRALSQPAHRKKLRATRTPGAAKPKAVLANHGVVDIEDCDAVPEMLSRGSPLEAVPLVPVHRRGRLKMRRREVSHSRAAASAGSRPPSPSQSSAAQAPGASATLSSQNTTTNGSKASSHPAVPEPPQESASRRPQHVRQQPIRICPVADLDEVNQSNGSACCQRGRFAGCAMCPRNTGGSCSKGEPCVACDCGLKAIHRNTFLDFEVEEEAGSRRRTLSF